MARKNLLANLINDPAKPDNDRARVHEANNERPEARIKHTGALGAVTRSIDALAAKAAAAGEIEKKLVEGEVVIELDTEVVDGSFISDRLSEDDQAFRELLEAIRLRGQDSPILVRPHPTSPGRYQVAFGHRRLKVAKILGTRVRAVVKKLDDRSHVVAQGQENSARADLSFIERAFFARGLEEANFDRETIMAALTVDKTTISKMLLLFVRIPKDILATIQNAYPVGRDRWNNLSASLASEEVLENARALIQRSDYLDASPVDRFFQLEKLVKAKVPRQGAASQRKSKLRSWQEHRGRVSAKIRANDKRYSLVLEAKDALPFGAFIEDNLQRLYQEFEGQQKSVTNGD